MDRDTAATLIYQRIGFRQDLLDNGYIVNEMQAAQTYAEQHSAYLPDFLLSEKASLTMTADEERVALPDDFLREDEGVPFRLFDSTGTTKLATLSKEEYYDLEEEYAESAPTQPKHYSLVGSYFRCFPIPDDAYILKFLYYKADTPLTTNIENKWLAKCPDWLIGETGMRVALFLQNSQLVAIFKALRDNAMETYRIADEARKSANRRYQMGAPH